MRTILFTLSVLISLIVFSGCAAQTMIEKRNLDVQTKMSASVFLEPVAKSEQIVFIKARNTSDKDVKIEELIKNIFVQKGYTITDDPAKANFMIQANLLQVAKTNANDAKNALGSAFGGGLIGAGISMGAKGSNSGTAAAGLVGAALGFVGDTFVKDVYYTMITDVEIRQRPLSGETVSQNSNLNFAQGTNANETQVIQSRNVQWKKYQTRIVSIANKVNLEFEEAKEKLEEGLVRSISGIL